MILLERSGDTARIRIAAGRGNVLGSGELSHLEAALQRIGAARAVILEAAGPDFSLGASIEEHLPDKIEGMLPALHGVIRALLRGPPSVAVIQGRCLGGGLELALACSRIVAAPDASFGLPEVKLGVFAPAGAALLPLRIGPARARDLLLRGRTVDAEEALRLGLVDELVDAPGIAARRWAEEIAGHSAVAVDFTRRALAEEGEARLAVSERLYLQELLATRDGTEGIRAFLEKRPPRWSHR